MIILHLYSSSTLVSSGRSSLALRQGTIDHRWSDVDKGWQIFTVLRALRDAPPPKKRENVGIFPKWGTPPPPPPVWEPHVCEKKLRFILHFRTLGTFLVFTKMFTYGWYYGL